jgi:hypothetical protein
VGIQSKVIIFICVKYCCCLVIRKVIREVIRTLPETMSGFLGNALFGYDRQPYPKRAQSQLAQIDISELDKKAEYLNDRARSVEEEVVQRPGTLIESRVRAEAKSIQNASEILFDEYQQKMKGSRPSGHDLSTKLEAKCEFRPIKLSPLIRSTSDKNTFYVLRAPDERDQCLDLEYNGFLKSRFSRRNLAIGAVSIVALGSLITYLIRQRRSNNGKTEQKVVDKDKSTDNQS